MTHPSYIETSVCTCDEPDFVEDTFIGIEFCNECSKDKRIEEYSYWEIQYKSCEGNERWTIARTPFEWDEFEVRDNISMGGCGDDPAEIKSVFETNSKDFSWDFCE